MCKSRLNMYNYVINYANNHNIDYITIINNKNIGKLLRDGVHTTDLGAKYYGNFIYNKFINKIINKKVDDININTIKRNIYYDIKLLNVNKTVNNFLTLYGNAKVIGIYQNIGPYSGIVNIIDDESNITKQLIWDQWCNYERQNIKLSFDVKNKTTIKVSDDVFDTSACKHDIDWLSYNKKLEIIDIFYVGEIDDIIIDTI